MPGFAQNNRLLLLFFFSFFGSWTCYLYSTYFICTNLLQAVTILFVIKGTKKFCHANSHWRELGILRNKINRTSRSKLMRESIPVFTFCLFQFYMYSTLVFVAPHPFYIIQGASSNIHFPPLFI